VRASDSATVPAATAACVETHSDVAGGVGGGVNSASGNVNGAAAWQNPGGCCHDEDNETQPVEHADGSDPYHGDKAGRQPNHVQKLEIL